MPNAAVFSIGSDGTDGPTDAAGGYSDGDTAGVLKNKGIDIFEVLKNNDAYNALKDKISDYFMRCRLLAFDPVVAESVSVSVKDIASVADCPLAKPSMSGLLPFNAINPAWQA